MRTSRRSAAASTAVGLVLGLVLSACASSSGGAPDPNAPFEVWTRSTEAAAKVYTRLFAEFERKTGVKVDYKPIFTDFESSCSSAPPRRTCRTSSSTTPGRWAR